MKTIANYLWVIFSFFLSACSTMQVNKTPQDSYGVMSIVLPQNWHDETEDYLRESEEVRGFGKVRVDSGIRQLLYIVSDKNDSVCQFRELTYSSGEVGYFWTIARLTEEVAGVKNHVLDTHGVSEYLKLGVPIRPVVFSSDGSKSIVMTNKNHTQFISSKSKQLGLYEGWESIYTHTFGANPAEDYGVVTWTYSLLLPQVILNNGVKKYLVAECAVEGSPSQQNRGTQEIIALMQTIQLNPPKPSN